MAGSITNRGCNPRSAGGVGKSVPNDESTVHWTAPSGINLRDDLAHAGCAGARNTTVRCCLSSDSTLSIVASSSRIPCFSSHAVCALYVTNHSMNPMNANDGNCEKNHLKMSSLPQSELDFSLTQTVQPVTVDFKLAQETICLAAALIGCIIGSFD